MDGVASYWMIGMDGTEIITNSTTSGLQSKTWVIRAKLSESSFFFTESDKMSGFGPGYAAGKFRCHDKADPTREAFMRIYRQIPVAGTEGNDRAARAAQAVSNFTVSELHAFRTFNLKQCTAAPELLGYHEGQQPEDGLVPGGFTTTIVWEAVPGSPLSRKVFWSLDREKRDLIRENFRSAYE